MEDASGTQQDQGQSTPQDAVDAPSLQDNAGYQESSESQAARSEAPAEKTFTKAEVEARIRERLAREKTKAQESAEAAAMEARAQWEDLAKKRQSKIDELTPQSERAERLEAVLSTYVDAEKRGFPEHIASLLNRMPIEEQLEWISENKEAVAGNSSSASSSAGDELPQNSLTTALGRRSAPDATRGKTPIDSTKAFDNHLRQRIGGGGAFGR